MNNTQSSKLLTIVANILSIGFQPILMPIFCLVLLYEFNPVIHQMHDRDTTLLIYVLGVTFTILIPLVVFGIFYWLGWVSDVNLTKRKERVIPFFISIILFGGFYYLVKTNPKMDDFILPLLFGFILGTLIANLITTVWKISIHALGIASTWGAVVVTSIQYDTYAMPLLVALGVLTFGVSWSRLHLNRHTFMQLVAGSFLGFFSTFLCAYFKIYI